MECNLHWDNLSYWTFFPHRSFHRLRSATPERLVAAYLGSVEAFAGLWSTPGEGGAGGWDPGGRDGEKRDGGRLSHAKGNPWAEASLDGISREATQVGVPPSHTQVGVPLPQLDLQRVQGVAALGLMGHWLSREAAPPVIPSLEKYIEGVARNEGLPAE